MKEALAPYGVDVTFVEDWEYHVSMGEVHCGTNTTRAIPETKWWETGR
jgi:protein-arginine deiminase